MPGSVALAALAAPARNVRPWLLDTGCKYDLTMQESSPESLPESIIDAPMPITLSTANDLVNGDKVIRQQIGAFNEVAEPYVLASTPDVLSIGRRCVENGYHFEWEPYSIYPTMTLPSGEVVTLVSRDCCP